MKNFAAELWAETLSLAIADAERLGTQLLNGPVDKSNPVMREGLDAIEWMFFSSDDNNKIGSFAYVCMVLDLDSKSIRRRLASRWLIKVVGKFYRHYVLQKTTPGVITWQSRALRSFA